MPPPSILLWFRNFLKLGRMQESAPSKFFFPAKESACPVLAEAATFLETQLLGDSDAVDTVGNIYIESAGLYKCEGGAQHEFLTFRLRDKRDATRKNVMILDRVPRHEVTTQPDPNDSASLHITIEDLERSQPTPGPTSDHDEPSRFPTSNFRITCKASVGTMLMRNLPAADMFVISRHNDLDGMCAWRELTRYRQLEGIDIPHKELGVEKILVLAAAVSCHSPVYDLYTHQCYWYAGVVWDVTCRLAGQSPAIPSSERGKANTRFISIAPGNVDEADNADQMLTLFKKKWLTFTNEIQSNSGRGLAAVKKDRDEYVAKFDASLHVQDELREQLKREKAENDALRARLAALDPE